MTETPDSTHTPRKAPVLAKVEAPLQALVEVPGQAPAAAQVSAPVSAKVSAQLRALPAVDRVLRALADESPAAARASREVLDQSRAELQSGVRAVAPELPVVVAAVAARLRASGAPAYPRAVNATGIFLHTGLGRAPLAAAALDALQQSATGFTQLEVDPATGERRHREHALLADLRVLTGGAAATVVNNNAAALLLGLSALAHGRQVIVSRGELIEIGGGFRLPDLMRLSGAKLVEVGTTNRTYARDVQAAIGPETALILRVHTSNFRVVGFAHAPAREELAALAREHGVPLFEDLGSGLLAPAPGGRLAAEPDVRSALAAGVDLVCFSGDKLLGGPQAGLLVGREDLVARCRRHDLFRALRPDRLCLTALAATLRLWRESPDAVPVHAALTAAPRDRLERARALCAQLAARFPAASFEVVPTEAQAGSGSLPARELASSAVTVIWPGMDAEALARALRTCATPVHSSVQRGELRLDVLALLPGDDARIEAALAALMENGGSSGSAPGSGRGGGA